MLSFTMPPNDVFLHYFYNFFTDKTNCVILIFNEQNKETATILEINESFLLTFFRIRARYFAYTQRLYVSEMKNQTEFSIYISQYVAIGTDELFFLQARKIFRIGIIPSNAKKCSGLFPSKITIQK